MRGWGFVCAAIAVAACGGSASSSTETGTTCPQFTPCGGSVLGTWNVVSECFSTGVGGSSGPCKTTINVVMVNVSGTVTFNADGTYSSNSTSTATETSIESAGCFGTGDGGPPPVCSSSDPQSSCVPWEGGCKCTTTSTSSGMGMGTWAASGSTLTSTSQGGNSSSTGYCASGSDLTIGNPVGGADGGGIGAVLVLHR